jgi:hypothetical protein
MRRMFCFTAFAIFVAGISANAPTASAEQRGQIQICHIPGGNTVNGRTIMVDVHALPAHLAHGDYVGACGLVIPL